MTSTYNLTTEQYLALETLARTIVDRNLPDLRIGIKEHDLTILTLASENLQNDIEAFPRQYLDFLVIELTMMLAANTSGDLLVGLGELPDE